MNVTLKLYDGRIHVRVGDQSYLTEPRVAKGQAGGGQWTKGGGGGAAQAFAGAAASPSPQPPAKGAPALPEPGPSMPAPTPSLATQTPPAEFPEPDGWASVPEQMQDDARELWMNRNFEDERNYLIKDWRENLAEGEGRQTLIDDANADADSGIQTPWIAVALGKLEDDGEWKLPFTKEQIAGAINLDHTGDTDSGDFELDVKIDDSRLGLPEGWEGQEEALPGIPAETPSDRLTDHMRNQIRAAITEAFPETVSDWMNEHPFYPDPEMIRDNLDENWEGMGDADRFAFLKNDTSLLNNARAQWAVAHGQAAVAPPAGGRYTLGTKGPGQRRHIAQATRWVTVQNIDDTRFGLGTSGGDVEVAINPTKQEVIDLSKRDDNGFVRLFRLADGTVAAWPASQAIHRQIADALVKQRETSSDHYVNQQEMKYERGKMLGGYSDEEGDGRRIENEDMWFRPEAAEGEEFVSPNVETLDLPGALKALTSERHKKLAEAAADIDETMEMAAKEDDVIGAWSDGAEDSVMATVKRPDWAKLQAAAAMKGALAHQKQVLVFQGEAGGHDLFMHFDVPNESLAKVHQTLLDAGVHFHTIRPEGSAEGPGTRRPLRVYAVDTDGTAIDSFQKAAAKYGQAIEYLEGKAAFIGDHDGTGSDAEQRERARGEYERIIQSAQSPRLPAGQAAERWAGLRDRWGQALEATEQVAGAHDEAWETEPRVGKGSPEGGQWTSSGGGGSGGAATTGAPPGQAVFGAPPNHPGHGYSSHARILNGVIHTDNVYDATRALYEKRNVELHQPREVAVLLKHLGEVTARMIRLGEKAPVFDLCEVTVEGTNLFCAQSMGIPRVKMPQLDLDQTKGFLKYLEGRGYKIEQTDEESDHLRATQNELNGAKVAAIAAHWDPAKVGRTVVSRDNYILDGHHRWAAQIGVDAADNKFTNVTQITRVDIGITELLRLADEFTGGTGHEDVAAPLEPAPAKPEAPKPAWVSQGRPIMLHGQSRTPGAASGGLSTWQERTAEPEQAAARKPRQPKKPKPAPLSDLPKPALSPAQVKAFSAKLQSAIAPYHMTVGPGGVNMAPAFHDRLVTSLQKLGQECPLDGEMSISSQWPLDVDLGDRENMARGSYAAMQSNILRGHHLHDMWINPYIYADEAEATKTQAGDLVTEFHDGVADPMSAITHEYGHALQASINQVTDPELKITTRDLGEISIKDALARISDLYLAARMAAKAGLGSVSRALAPTGYALSSPQEWWAECFSVSHHGSAEFKNRQTVRLEEDIVKAVTPQLTAIRDGKAKPYEWTKLESDAVEVWEKQREAKRPETMAAILDSVADQVSEDDRPKFQHLVSVVRAGLEGA